MPREDLENLFGFGLHEHTLSKNYRSSKKIISYFEHFKTHENEIQPFGQNKEYQSTISYNSTVELDGLIDEIIRLILFNIKEKQILPSEICIVAPQWIHLAGIKRKLMIRLPDYSFDGPGMAPFSRDIENFWYKVTRIVLTEPSPYMYVRRLRWSKEILDNLEIAGVDISELHSKRFLRICNAIVIEENNGLAYLEQFFKEICATLSIDLVRYPLLQEHHDSFFASSRDRIQRLEKEGNPFIGEIENFRKVFKQRDGITVSTIHGVKGEEYDTVIGYALLNDYIPHFSDGNGHENAKKLLYVLASRARKNLHLISEKYRAVHPDFAPEGKIPTPHLINYKYDYDLFD